MSHWGIVIFSASNVFNTYILIYYYTNYINISDNNIIIKKSNKRSLNYNKFNPLNIDILSIIYGSLLGDSHAEKRKQGKGTRISFYQENTHTDYLLYLHNLISSLGYCNETIPKITTRLGKNGKLRKIIRFHTWTYVGFNYIHNEWYKNNKKVLPKSIENYLTPLALSIWIMDDGSKASKGLKLCTNSFSYNEVLFLIEILYKKYKLKASIQKSGIKDQYVIYIWKESMPLLMSIVSPYIIPSMKYKLNNNI